MDIQPVTSGVVMDTITINAATVIMALFSIVNLIGLGLLAIILWIGKEAIADLRALENGHSRLKESLPINYVRKDDYSRDIREIKDMLTRLFERLDQKADKHNGPP